MKLALRTSVLGRALHVLSVALLAGLFGLGSALPAAAQATKKVIEKETVKGTLTAIEKKGKTAKLTIDREGGDPLELTLTPKMQLAIEGTGDRECLRPNVVVSTEAFQSNNQLFASDLVVHFGIPPAVGVQRDAQRPEVYKVCGAITAVDEQGLSVNFGAAGGVRRLMFDSAATLTVKVVSSDVSHLEEGAAVELEGMTRAGKFLPSGVKVAHEKAFTAEELFASSKMTKTKAVPEPKTPAKKTTKPGTKEAMPAEGEGANADDPFGVLKKDMKTAPKAKPGAKPAPKTEMKEEMEAKKGTL